MARRKSWFKRTFGNKFNLWDLLLLVALIGYPTYIASTKGWEALFVDLGGYIYSALIVAYFISLIRRKARK